MLYLGRSLTFWYDEWRSITFDGGLVDFLRPVNEHWLTLPLLLYRATFHVFELHSYLPYLAQVIVLHLVAVAGAYVLMRRRLDVWLRPCSPCRSSYSGQGPRTSSGPSRPASSARSHSASGLSVLVETGRRGAAVAASASSSSDR